MPKNVFYKIPKDRQLKLLKPALKEFVMNPYEKITVSSLTETMKILRTDFYYYFTDKDDIYNYLIQEFVALIPEDAEKKCLGTGLIALFEKAASTNSPRVRQYITDLCDNYHPQFVNYLAIKAMEVFGCEDTDGLKKIKVTCKIHKFMNVLSLYKKGEIDKEKAIEAIKM